MKHLNQSLDDLEQYSRKDCIEIRGIPAATAGQPENTNEIVVELGKCMGLEIEKEDISVSHRPPIRKKGKFPAIIVKSCHYSKVCSSGFKGCFL